MRITDALRLQVLPEGYAINLEVTRKRSKTNIIVSYTTPEGIKHRVKTPIVMSITEPLSFALQKCVGHYESTH